MASTQVCVCVRVCVWVVVWCLELQGGGATRQRPTVHWLQLTTHLFAQTQVLAGLLAVLLGISLYAHLGVRDDGKCPFSGSSEMPAEGHPATGTASSTPRQQSSAQERSGRSADAPRVWLPDELSEYDGSPDKPIMLAVLGQVCARDTGSSRVCSVCVLCANVCLCVRVQ